MLQEQFQHHGLHRWPFVFENQLTFILQGRGERRKQNHKKSHELRKQKEKAAKFLSRFPADSRELSNDFRYLQHCGDVVKLIEGEF
jgi:hypothetical protein